MEAYKLASQAVTVPNTSEHQLGLALDIYTSSYMSLDFGFGETKAGIWLRENCSKYGFILRYPMGKEDVTGYPYEPWHIRYVGVEVATEIMENNLTLEDVQIRLHIGNTADNTRTGWIDISELIKEDQVERQVESQEMVVTANYDGVQENFNGSTIEIDTADGKVTLNVVDANGNLLAPGSIVVGSDGKEYQIGSLNLSTVEVMQEQTVTETVTQEKEVVGLVQYRDGTIIDCLYKTK